MSGRQVVTFVAGMAFVSILSFSFIMLNMWENNYQNNSAYIQNLIPTPDPFPTPPLIPK